MSSVGRSGEDAGQLREFYMQRENEKEKAHQDEIKKLRLEHAGELARSDDQSKRQIDDIRARTHQKMSQQDLQHQKEIEALKAMYKKKLEDAGGKD